MMKPLLIAVFAFLLLYAISAFNVALPIEVTTSTRSTELSVVGEGKVEVVPDTAYVDLGISVNNVRTVEATQSSITETNNKIIAAMKDLGIDKADVQTSNYSVAPNYTYTGSVSRIDGYNGNVTISIRVHDKDILSKVIEKATTAGANVISGTRFVVDKPEKYREEARTKAIDNAKQQAQKIASDLGIKLGRVTNIVESSPSTQPQPVMYDKAMSAGMGGGSASPNIEPGSETINSVVTLYFDKR